MRNTVCLMAGLLALTVTQSAPAAKSLGPPIEDLQSTPDRLRIVFAEAKGKPEKGKIRFAIAERLVGEAPEEVVLRTDQDSYLDVKPGQRYVVAWTYMRRNRGVIGGYENDPAGPSTVTVLGLGATTIFEGTPEMRYLFSPGVVTDPDAADRVIAALLTQMRRPDHRSRGLVIAELYLRNDLTESINEDQADILRDVLAEKELDDQHRDLLYQSALRVDRELTTPWLAEDMRRTIDQHGTEYDLRSFVPSLVISAAEGLQQVGDTSDIDRLGELLYANNPGVSKAALRAIAHLDQDAAKARAEEALQSSRIHGETRNALTRYLSTGQIR